MSVKTQGFAELDLALAQFAESTGKNILRRVGQAALKPFDEAWRAKAPVKTGALAKSGGVGSKLSRSQRAKVVRESTVEVFAGPGADPAATQDEFGNSHQAPQPYVRPAWDETQGQVLDIVKRELADEIQKTAARVARRAAKRGL